MKAGFPGGRLDCPRAFYGKIKFGKMRLNPGDGNPRQPKTAFSVKPAPAIL
jgi:hypothetical protein